MPRRAPTTLRAQAVTWLAQRDHSERELRGKLLRWLRSGPSGRAPTPSTTGLGGGVPSDPDGPGDSGDRGDPGDPPGASARGALAEPDSSLDAPSAEARAAAVDEVLTWLRRRGFLDDQRFAATRADGRAPRFGLARIRHELAQLGVELDPAQSAQLMSTELPRALALWERRFGSPASDPREAARQARFLAGRGFSMEVVRQVLRAAGRQTGPPSAD